MKSPSYLKELTDSFMKKKKISFRSKNEAIEFNNPNRLVMRNSKESPNSQVFVGDNVSVLI